MQSRIMWFGMFAIMTALAGAFAHAAEEQIVTSGKVKFVSGGVGEESIARMRALEKEFNLKLLFAAKDGHYLSGVAVTVANERGAKVIDTVTQGPWLFAAIGPGKYVITATYEGKKVTQETTVAASGRREVFFRWEEPAYSGGANGKS